MKIKLAVVLLVLLFVGTATAQPIGTVINKDAKDAPKSDPNTWDFGRVTQGDVLKHEFSVKNETNKVLNIKDVTTSCGCTGSEIKKKALEPAETTVLEVKFNSKGYVGDIQQHIFVNTDNLDNPVLRFIIKANVVIPAETEKAK